jgi:hypothetical protein
LSSVPLARLLPESDLRTVTIRAPGARPSLAECAANGSLEREPDALFFGKGSATADGFRPVYWTYAVPDADEPRAVERAAPEKPNGTSAYLARLETEFLESQRRMLNEPRSFEDDDAASFEEKPVRSEPNGFPPEADLRTIVVRPRAPALAAGSGSLEDLFAKKTEAPPPAKRIEPPPAKVEVPAPAKTEAPAAAAACASDVVFSDAPPEPVVARAAKEPPPPPPEQGVGLRVTVLACTCAALAVIFAGRAALAPKEPPIVTVEAPAVVAPAPIAAAPVAVAPAPPVAAAAPPAVPAPPPISPAAEALLEQGNQSLSVHDITAARLYFERAAEEGSGRAALLAGMTYDPMFLRNAGAYGIKGSESEAQTWYRRARDLGDPDAAKFLSQSAER